MKRTTLSAVNAAIRAAGGAEVLVRGRGYFFFTEGDTARWPRTAVYTYHLGALSIEEWISEWRSLQAESQPTNGQHT